MARYFYVDLLDGAIYKTDCPEKAHDLSLCEDFFVLDTETGTWLVDGEPVEVKEKT